MNVFELFAKLSLDTKDYDDKLNKAKREAEQARRDLANTAKKGVTAMNAMTVAAAGFEASAVKTGMDFDKSMSQVYATMGLSAEEAANQMGEVDLAWGHFNGNLRDYAKEMGKNTAFSASEAADALNYMALAGYDVQTSMEMLPNVLNLAAAGNMDLARASDMVTDTQTAFGINIERTNQLVDEMAKAASTGNTSVEQLGDAFLVVGGLAQELNGGIVTLDDGTQVAVDGVQELEIALTAMANAGVKGSEAGTHMRNILLKLSSPTDDGTLALEKLGVAIYDDEGKMRSLHDIFGDMNDALKGDVLPSFTDFYNEISKMNSEDILKKFEEAPEDFEFFGVSVVDAEGHLKDFNSVYAEAQDMFEGGISQEDKIQAFADMFNVRDLSAAEAILNSMDDDWDNIGESILDAQGSAQKMADTQLDNLAGDVTKFKSALENAKITMSEKLMPVLREIVDTVTKFVQNGGIEKIIKAFKTLAPVIAGVNTAMITFKTAMAISKTISAFTKATEGATMAQKLFNLAMNTNPIVLIVTAITTLIATLITLYITNEDFRNFINACWEGIKDIIYGVYLAIKSIVDGWIDLFKNFSSILEWIWDGITSGVENAWNGIKDFFGTILDGIKMLFETVFGGIGDFVSGVWNGIKSAAEFVWGTISDVVGGAIDGVVTFVTDFWNGLVEIWDNITGWISDIATAFWDMIKSAWEWGANLAREFWDGVKSGAKNLYDVIMGNEEESVAIESDRNLKGASFRGRNAMQTANGASSDTNVTVYIGQEQVDDIVVNNEQRRNFRSGGR